MLSATSKLYIEASVPVLREHGLTITTTFYENMFKNHPELMNIFNAGNQANGSQQQSLASAVFAYAANIENSDALAPVVERIVHKHASVGIKAEHYPIVGKYLIEAIKEVLKDAATPELLAAWVEAYGLLADALITAEQKLYQQNRHEPDSWMKVKVTAKQTYANGVISYSLQASEGSKLPTFKAGQYISVAVFLESAGLRQIRQYSLSNAPNTNTYRITIKGEKADKNKPEGMVSNWIQQHAEVGSTIDISHPYGNFTPDVMDNTPIALISAGIGITPMISILTAIANDNPNRGVLFAHAAENKDVIAHYEDIEAAKNKMYALDTKLFLKEGAQNSNTEIKGRMDLSTIEQLKDTIYYICGPQAFMDEQMAALLKLGVNQNRIHREVFGPESLNHLL